MIYTVYFTQRGATSDLFGQYSSRREADSAVRYLWTDEDVILVTVDITRKAS